MESILFLALTLALHIAFCQYQFMLLKLILEGICANMNILKYCITCTTIFLKYSINKNLAPALALLGRYRSTRAMHRSSAGSGGRILRIFPQYLRIFSHGLTTIRCQLFGKKFPQQNACLTLKFIEETVICTFLQGDKSFWSRCLPSMIVISAKRLGLPALADSDFFLLKVNKSCLELFSKETFFDLWKRWTMMQKRDSETRVMARPMHCRGSDWIPWPN